MRGIFYPEIGTVEVRELPDPTIQKPTDAIVKVVATSVCGTDIHLFQGHQFPQTGFPLGHEWVGEITELGESVTGFAVGDRVIGSGGIWCGDCPTCRRGVPECCERGGGFGMGPALGDHDGAQSQFIRVPFASHDLTRVPDEVSDAAALTVGDILATGWAAVKHCWEGPGSSLLVIGCGPVGLSAIHTGKHLAGASTVIAVDTVPERLEMARTLGADHVLTAGEGVADQVRALTHGRGADSVVDAAGAQATIDLAVDAAAVGGKIALIALAAMPVTMTFPNLFMKRLSLWTGLADLGSNELLLEAIADGRLDPTPMFTGPEIALDEVPALYQRLAKGDLSTVKVLVRPNA